MKSILVFCVLIAVSSAHLCLVAPPQRGSMNDIYTAGADDCKLTDPDPCGGRKSEMPRNEIKAASNVTVVFQKNLDHFYSVKPGSFNVSLWMGMKKMMLMSIPDSGEDLSLHFYTPMVTIPSGISGDAILQVVYTTNNPAAPPYFYQCADIKIT